MPVNVARSFLSDFNVNLILLTDKKPVLQQQISLILCFGVVGLEWYPCYRLLFHFLCVQHVSDINISIIRSLRLFC